MTTSTASLTRGVITAIAPQTATAPMVTNTCTVTLASGIDTILIRVRIVKNDDTDAPTVQGSGTLILTVVDSGSVTQLTTAALIGTFDTVAAASIQTDYFYAVSNKTLGGAAVNGQLPTLGIFTIVATASAGDTDVFIYQVDAIGLSSTQNPFNQMGLSGPVTALGTENPATPN